MRPSLRVGAGGWDGDLRAGRAGSRGRPDAVGFADAGRDGNPPGFESGEMPVDGLFRDLDGESEYGRSGRPMSGFRGE